MASGAWYVYVQTFFDQFDFVAKTAKREDAERVAEVLRGRIRSETGCVCMVHVERISKRTAVSNALDDKIKQNLERGRRDEPAVEAFAARIAAELLAPPPATIDRSSSATTTAEHPALTLFHALNSLHVVCSNAHLFVDLAVRRAEARKAHVDILNMQLKIATDRAKKLAREGAPHDQQQAALAEGMKGANDPPPSNEPAAYTKSLRENVLDRGRKWCERARAALRAGGAKGLDAVSLPNTAGQMRSIEFHTKLQDADRVFSGLTVGVGDPRIVIDKDAARMAELRDWFAHARDELGAVIETRGLDGDNGGIAPPTTSPPNRPDRETVAAHVAASDTSTAVDGSDPLDDTRDALFGVTQHAGRLAKAVERLEARYTQREEPDPSAFYVLTESGTWGCELEPGWADHAPASERRSRGEAIDAALALRASVDSAIRTVSAITSYMDSDSQSVDQRWTTRTISQLRTLRTAIVRGHGKDFCPSALPMIRAGVPDALRESSRHILGRMEEVKSAILANVKPRASTVSISPELLERLERAAAAADPQAIARAAELAAEKVTRVLGQNDTAPSKTPSTRTEVVLWEGATHSDRNVRLARTRSAYLEAHGDVEAARESLQRAGHPVGKSTFYDHLNALDTECPGWRMRVLVSGASGNPEKVEQARTRGKSQGKVR